MKIFISWSGERSRLVGELLEEWIMCVLQAVEPWMSSKNIDRGSIWFNEINSQLKDTGMGIVCLTTQNLNKPWILFESGALSKGLSNNRVCTLLIDLQPSDVSDPLGQFNHTLPNKIGIKQLIFTINRLLEKPLGEKILNKVYDNYWPEFEKTFNEIISKTEKSYVPIERDQNDILIDILSSIRGLDRRIRNVENHDFRVIDGGNFIDEKKVFNHAAIINRVHSLIRQGIDLDDIPDMLEEINNVPPIITKRILDTNNILNTIEESR